ncbi:CapA family protein [Arthrobacter sp. Br18]|uniref:CapA family protein n=1 Tax=Arthrobacter sp. Br18 TaxID=1312954 RepID=UPI000479E078|nr:CapA family protein [Arthrobacter sp. Br18]
MARILTRVTSLGVAVALLSSACSAQPAEDTPDPTASPTVAAAPTPAPPAALPQPEPTPGKGPECPTKRCFSVTVSGDLLVHPQLWDQAADDAAETGKGSLDFEPLLAAQRPYLENSDLGLCHLETPVAPPEGPFSGYPQFNVPPQIVTAAKEVGYQACTTASNHSIDASIEGLLRTLDTLDAAGLGHTGSYATEADAQRILMLETPAARVAVIEATYGLNGLVPDQPWRVDMLDIPTMVAKAEAARAQGADVVIAALHAGDEYASMPNDQQVQTAHALADSGTIDFIYGHHTHSVLPIEKYADTWIVYGLGNGVTELSPTYDVNNEGLTVRAQFAQDDAGAWSVRDLAWVPSMIVRDPYRWCSLAPDQPAGSCAAADVEDAARERTRSVVEAFGAAGEGAHQWDLAAETPAP